MKVYIQTDIEGCAGFVFPCSPIGEGIEALKHYERMCRLLTGEVNAAVEGAFNAGAEKVLVNDSHGSGYNIIFEDLDQRCEIIHGRNCSGPHWMPLLDASFDALVLIGMHAMTGTKNSITPHSKWEVNAGELYMSEGSMAAAIAGDYGIPTVFASGDDKIISELTEKNPKIRTEIVKIALSAYQAKSLQPLQACDNIRIGVENAVRSAENISPYIFKGPVSLNLIEMRAPDFQPKHVFEKPVTGDTINKAFMSFLKKAPWVCFDTDLPDGFRYP